jgi:hypothetical protein
MAKASDTELSEIEIVRLMNNAVRRALNTPPKPHKEIVGKSERAAAKSKNQIKKAAQAKPKSS